MIPTSGVRALKLVGGVTAGCGFVVLCLAIPTTCMLPYSEYAFLHAKNYIYPLGLIYVGVIAMLTGCDMERINWTNPATFDPVHLIKSGQTMKRLLRPMLMAIFCITEGSGELIYDYSDGTFYQVVKHIRTGKWGDLNPTAGQMQALDWMYGFINVAYVVARMALVLGVILATVIWINRANATETEKHAEEIAGVRKRAGKGGEQMKMLVV